MTYEEYEVLDIGDLVVCTHIDEDMPFGWNSAMNEFVGRVLPVEDKHHNEGVSLSIESLGLGPYTFHISVLEVVNKEFETTVQHRNYKLKQAKVIPISVLRHKIPNNLFRKLPKSLTDNKILKFDQQNHDIIMKRCPRLLGSLLANGYINIIQE